MRHFAVVLITLSIVLFPAIAVSQEGFQFTDKSKKRVVVPFKFINNLIFIPVKVNGVELTFLLDTGVEETILFSLEENQQVGLSDVKKIRMIGLGGSETVEGLRSRGNYLSVRGLRDEKHDLYIVLDQEFNFSANVGIPVNGIIGYAFFRNHPVHIDFERRKLTVYRDRMNMPKRIRDNYQQYPISIENAKPYTMSEVAFERDTIRSKFLIDLGSSDALWLFGDRSSSIKVPARSFEDFLGRGLSGDVNGRRARVRSLKFCEHTFRDVVAAFPEENSLRGLSMVEGRVGSIGSEVLSRFRVVFDYSAGIVMLQKGRKVGSPFLYNLSGIEIHHDGMIWVQERSNLISVKQGNAFANNEDGAADPMKVHFALKPSYTVSYVRKGSPGELAGIKKGDKLVSIDEKPTYRYSLQDIGNILRAEDGKLVRMEVERGGRKLKFAFRLKSII